LPLRLETIPLGVNPEKFRPAALQQRAARRAALHIRDEAVAILFVDRFAPHAKAHPFPMLQGIAQAVRQTGQPAHLIPAGWAASPSLLDALVESARRFAPGVPVSVVNGMDRELRYGVWEAEDVFTSLADSIQETFGLVILEGMTSGLPVVPSDWDGYRDLVVDGETGFLVPTYMVSGATEDTTARLLLQAVDYDAFLAECNQRTVVDPASAAAAYSRLLTDAALRQHMGAAGRQRVLERFIWATVVRAYKTLWISQEDQRQAWVASNSRTGHHPEPSASTLPAYPAPEVCFAADPTHLLDEDSRLVTTAGTEAALRLLWAHPLMNHATGQFVRQEALLGSILEKTAVPRTVFELDEELNRQGVGHGSGHAILAWLLK
jgi:hypothetical protein